MIHRWLEHPLVKQPVSYKKYRDKVRHVYDGPQGAMLATCSMLSLHAPLGDRLFRERRFDLRGARQILDVGSGAGQIARHVLKYADRDAELTCFDLSHEMLRRARARLKSDRPRYVVADLTRLPFLDEAFDCITCGYVLEHVPDARLGLAELARVMMPGAKMLFQYLQILMDMSAQNSGCSDGGFFLWPVLNFGVSVTVRSGWSPIIV